MPQTVWTRLEASPLRRLWLAPWLFRRGDAMGTAACERQDIPYDAPAGRTKLHKRRRATDANGRARR